MWTDIESGEALREPWRLCRFLMLAFSDLKKYRFHYMLAFPALLPARPFTALPALALTDALAPAEVPLLYLSTQPFISLEIYVYIYIYMYMYIGTLLVVVYDCVKGGRERWQVLFSWLSRTRRFPPRTRTPQVESLRDGYEKLRGLHSTPGEESNPAAAAAQADEAADRCSGHAFFLARRTRTTLESSTDGDQPSTTSITTSTTTCIEVAPLHAHDHFWKDVPHADVHPTPTSPRLRTVVA